MKNIYYITCLIILIEISCGKTVYNRHVKGHVLDITTGLPVAGAWVELDGEQGGFFVPTIYETAGKTITDATGAFDFEYRKRRIAGYTIYAGADNYFFEPSADYADVDFSTHNKLEIKLHPKATLVLDVNRVSNAQYVYCRTGNTRGGGECDCSANQQYFNFEVEGNKKFIVSYTIFSLNGTRQRIDTSIYCHSFKNTIFRIDY